MEEITKSRGKNYYNQCVLRGEKWVEVNKKEPFNMSSAQLKDIEYYEARLALNKPKEVEEVEEEPEEKDHGAEEQIREDKPDEKAIDITGKPESVDDKPKNKKGKK